MDRIPLFPLPVVVFPGEPFGLHVFEERYLLMTEEVLAERLPIGMVLARLDEPEPRIEHDPEPVGTAVEVVAHEKIGDRYLLQTHGTRRFRIRRVHREKPYQEADVEWLSEEPGDAAAARQAAERLARRMRALGARVPDEAARDPVAFSHAVAASLRLDLGIKQRLLEATDALTRLQVEAELLQASS